MSEFLVFAGTTEGRKLIELLESAGAGVSACVATEYGRELLPEGVRVLASRMDTAEMTTLLATLRMDCVIDATHPYADQVSKNIEAACAATGTRRIRLLRPSEEAAGCVQVRDAGQAAGVLCATKGKVLLTTGSKDLEIFSQVPDFQNRIFPRVLPTLESVERCLSLGWPVRNIIAMQGPFTREMNAAMLRQIGASILVTKESGEPGGFLDKIRAARDIGATAVVIGRPVREDGADFEGTLALLQREFGIVFPAEKMQEAMRECMAWGGGTE